ncbi:type I 3-dehydroquinate dehydratase [Halopelagius longus]|uniref:Type I 3-dehydroquinate dehydratase n=2 Tax=Halopelagius longus TaxID=1236180 RepID=A0A370IHI7_9EURY|nr:type I 3-dehydroquinate dehydratase [Halopelagius longus]
MGVRSVSSYHDFEQTPRNEGLRRIITDCDSYGDLVKVVVFAENEQDTLSFLHCLNTASHRGVVIAGDSCGDVGKHRRVINL